MGQLSLCNSYCFIRLHRVLGKLSLISKAIRYDYTISFILEFKLSLPDDF